MEYLCNGDEGYLWITAIQQTSGKGSRGRNWVSDTGNLFASLALLSDLKPATLANLSFVSALALHDCLSNICDIENVSLKWPNDVLLDGSKVSGILLESQIIAAMKKTALVIGIGVNCSSNPVQTTHKATNLKKFCDNIEPEEVFGKLNLSMNYWLDKWDNGRNFEEIRHHWLAKAHGVGQQISVKTPKTEMRGIFENIDHDGCLILKQANNEYRTISTADIFFSNVE